MSRRTTQADGDRRIAAFERAIAFEILSRMSGRDPAWSRRDPETDALACRRCGEPARWTRYGEPYPGCRCYWRNDEHDQGETVRDFCRRQLAELRACREVER